MSKKSFPHSNSPPPAHDVDDGCASEPTPPPTAGEPTSPSGPPAEAPGLGGLNLKILPDIDVKADADALGTDVSASVSTDASSGNGDTASGGIDIDVALATPDLGGEMPLDIGGLLGGGESEGTHPLVSLSSETDAVVQVPLFGENGIVNGSHDVGSLLSAAMLDIGGDGGLGGIIGTDVYDGNVPLASDLSSALGSTLDLLTTTSSLFDVPALDILGCDGLDG